MTDAETPGSDGVFVLGTGAQKGGTTWLHAYLSRSEACAPGFAKEYTVFDTLDVPEHTWQRARILEKSAAALGRLETGDAGRRDAHELHRAAMLADTGLYYDYFATLLRRPGIRFTMDFTPNYALLSTERYEQIRSELARRGVETRVVMLLRDPVERIWSQVRMHLRQRSRRPVPAPHRKAEPEIVLDRYQRPTMELRTRYETTLARLDEVFPREAVHVELYERLFDDASVGAVCSFIGIDPHPAELDERVNVSPRGVDELPAEVVATVARHYAPTYAAVAERLGVPSMAPWWPSAAYVD